MEPVLVEWTQGRRAEPHVVIHPCGRVGIRRVTDIGDPIEVSRAADLAHLSDLPGLDHFHGFAVMVAAAPLGSHLADAVVARGGVAHGAAFGDAGGEGLFDIDVLAGLEGGDRGQGVPVVRRADETGVDIVPLNHAPEILHRCGSPAPQLFDAVGGDGNAVVVDVANHGDFGVGVGEERGDIAGGDAAPADQADADTIARSGLGGPCGGCGGGG